MNITEGITHVTINHANSTKSHTGSVRDLGGRMSSAVIDDVAAQIDRNYMQQYMEHHNNSTKK